MQHTSRKPFALIRDAYAFFQQHATETEADIRAYLPHLPTVATGDQPIRMLDLAVAMASSPPRCSASPHGAGAPAASPRGTR